MYENPSRWCRYSYVLYSKVDKYTIYDILKTYICDRNTIRVENTFDDYMFLLFSLAISLKIVGIPI